MMMGARRRREIRNGRGRRDEMRWGRAEGGLGVSPKGDEDGLTDEWSEVDG